MMSNGAQKRSLPRSASSAVSRQCRPAPRHPSRLPTGALTTKRTYVITMTATTSIKTSLSYCQASAASLKWHAPLLQPHKNWWYLKRVAELESAPSSNENCPSSLNLMSKSLRVSVALRSIPRSRAIPCPAVTSQATLSFLCSPPTHACAFSPATSPPPPLPS